MSPILQGLANGSVRGYGGYLPLGPSGAFESIASATGTGSSTTITFSSIPSTYTSLQIRGISKDAVATAGVSDCFIRFNSDSGNNYAYHNLTGNGTTASAVGVTSQPGGAIYSNLPRSGTGLSNIMGVCIVDIHDYASTTRYKTVRSFSGTDTNNLTTQFVAMTSSLWLNTSAITSISIVNADGNNFTTTTQFALYGIKGA